MSHKHGPGCRSRACLQINAEAQDAVSARMGTQILCVLILIGAVGWLALMVWTGDNRWVNGLMYAVYERLVP